MSAPERKYTDADVRADTSLIELAYEYLDTYPGEFDPLVRAQDVVRSGRPLTTPQIRVVLNCMRNDWDIADKMPRPMAKVIDMPVRDESSALRSKKKHKHHGYQGERYCDQLFTVLHSSHNWKLVGGDDHDYFVCPGRTNGRAGHLWIDARIKTPYVKAKGGRMIHLLGEGSYFHWTPYPYGDGFGGLARQFGTEERNNGLWGRFPPALNVKLLCKHPSWLRNPMLMWEIPDGLITNDGTPIELCIHCKKERDK